MLSSTSSFVIETTLLVNKDCKLVCFWSVKSVLLFQHCSDLALMLKIIELVLTWLRIVSCSSVSCMIPAAMIQLASRIYCTECTLMRVYRHAYVRSMNREKEGEKQRPTRQRVMKEFHHKPTFFLTSVDVSDESKVAAAQCASRPGITNHTADGLSFSRFFSYHRVRPWRKIFLSLHALLVYRSFIVISLPWRTYVTHPSLLYQG